MAKDKKEHASRNAPGAAPASVDPQALLQGLLGMPDEDLNQAIADAQAEADAALGKLRQLQSLKRLRDWKDRVKLRKSRKPAKAAAGDGQPDPDAPPRITLDGIVERLRQAPTGIRTLAADLTGIIGDEQSQQEVARLLKAHPDLFRQRPNTQWELLSRGDEED